MTQKPFSARNSINGCLRGIEGSPSHKMITFWALRCREGGRNSATICCLNLVLNMCPALSLMRRISSLARAIQEDCDQRLGLMQLFALVWENRRCPPENVLWGRRRLWKDWGKGWSRRSNPVSSGLAFHATGCSKRSSTFRKRILCACPQRPLVLTLVAYLDDQRDSLLVVRQDFIVQDGWQSIPSSPTRLDESSTEGADSKKKTPLIRLKRTPNEFSEPRLNSF